MSTPITVVAILWCSFGMPGASPKGYIGIVRVPLSEEQRASLKLSEAPIASVNFVGEQAGKHEWIFGIRDPASGELRMIRLVGTGISFDPFRGRLGRVIRRDDQLYEFSEEAKGRCEIRPYDVKS